MLHKIDGIVLQLMAVTIMCLMPIPRLKDVSVYDIRMSSVVFDRMELNLYHE